MGRSLKYDIPCLTTLSGAAAAVEGIAALQEHALDARPLQELYRQQRAASTRS